MIHTIAGQANTYLLWDDKQLTRQVIIIDPGVSADRICAALNAFDVVCGILVTHRHYDHIGGLPKLQQTFDVPVYIHADDAAGLTDSEVNLSCYSKSFTCNPAQHLLQGGETLELAGMTIKVIHVPGHSPGSVCYQCADGIFTGDFVFCNSVGRVDLPDGSMKVMRKSIHDFLQWDCPPETPLYPGHNEPTTYGAELAGNAFLRV